MAGIGSRSLEESAKCDSSIISPANNSHTLCRRGLGRAPVLVAVALIEQGKDPIDAIEFIRRKRRGAFNNRQITYLVDQYKRTSGSRSRTSGLRSGMATPSSQSPPHGPTASTHKSFFRKMFSGLN